MKLTHTAAFCAVLALGTFTAGLAQANDKKIAVVAKFDKKTEVKYMTAAELGTMLKELGFPQATIDTAIASGQKDGRLTLQAKTDKAPAKK